MREIQHCIDFVPGVSIPHKVAYKMSPKEYEELQRQVDELLSKGLIRESLSPWDLIIHIFLFWIQNTIDLGLIYSSVKSFI